MLNTLDAYIPNSLPQDGNFSTNPNLRKKVDGCGKFLPFRGNTIVFLLKDETKDKLALLQQRLYHLAGGMLAQRLDASTFHMTLHDLANGPEGDPGLEQRMVAAEEKSKQLLKQWRGLPPLRMKTTWLFNMVNTSIVLGLKPADADSWQRLDGMYCALEDVVTLGYALTPHITMAYFRPGTYLQRELEGLSKALTAVEFDVELGMDDLVFQIFRDMNHYETAE